MTKQFHTANSRLFENECYWLKALSAVPFVPDIIDITENDLSIHMKNCGEPISEFNAPPDWNDQLTKLLSDLGAMDCHHGDLLPQNILVNNGFKQVYDMGGITGWTDKGYPVITEG